MSDDKETNGTPSDEVEAPEAAESEPETPAEPVAEEPAAEAVESEPEAEANAEPAAEEEPAVEETEPAAEEEPAVEETEPAAEEPAPAEEPAAEAPQYDYHALHEMNVAQLREVAATVDHEAVHGYTTMHKEHLIPAICKALGIEAHEHHDVVGIDKSGVKAKIRALKKERDEAEAAGDTAKLKLARRRIRGLKRKIRKATV